MAEEQQNPYVAVLADLERQRDQIITTIAMIKRMMGLSADDGPVATVANGTTAPETAEIRSDTFFAMTIGEAIKKYLAMMKRPQRTTVIAKALDDGGLLHKSGNWVATVQTTLTRMKGVIVKVPNGWGLLEWYPGRSFEKKPATPDKRKKKRAKKSAAKITAQAKSSSAGDLMASRKLQGEYLGLLRKMPKEARETYKNLAKRDSRERAVSAMRNELMKDSPK